MVAVYEIADADKRKVFDFGLFNWDALIHNYVPAQLFGATFKNSLQFNIYGTTENAFGFEKAASTSQPGLVDAFRSFWYFGCIKFFIIGLIMRKLLAGALAGRVNYAFFYILLLPKSILIVTHSTQYFFSHLIHISIFLGTALFFARSRTTIPANQLDTKQLQVMSIKRRAAHAINTAHTSTR